jgi:cytochrome P450
MLIATGMPREALRDEVVTLFLAGHETTSHALTWTFALLSTHPDVEARLVDELGAVLGDRDPTHADLDRLPFTAAVVDEALRLYPTAYVVARVADRDTRIGDWPVPAGWQVTCWIWHCHRDPRWFEEPGAFRPDRFVDRAAPPAYLPFAAGSRMCIGAGFARMELRLLVATLVRRWKLRLVGPFPSPRPRVTLAPSSAVRMRVDRR